MESFIIKKELNIEDKKFYIHKTIPLKPVEMYNFLIKYLPGSIEKEKKNHPDFKHIFDYVESIKQYNDSYLLSILKIPQCASNSNGLGNFFGQKMNNISKDLKIFPFGNIVMSNISLVSKRTTNHSTFIILSLKGNKNLHDPHPSNPYQIKNTNNSVGYYLVDNWTNTVSKRYINYLYTNGLNSCIDELFLKTIPITQSNTDTKTLQPDTTKLQPDTTKLQPDTTKSQPDTTKLQPDTTQLQPDTAKSQPDITKSQPDTTKSQPDTTLQTIHNNNLTDDINIKHNELVFDNKYYKYQNDIINLKKMIYYLINNRGLLKDDIFYKFSPEILKNIFGNDYMIFLDIVNNT
jgi:hypothetical protein